MTKEELEEWRKDIAEAQQTYPTFANGPFVRALFKATQNIDVVGQFVDRLSGIAREIEQSVDDFKIIIKSSNEKSEKLSGRLLWLNIVLTCATVIGAIATTILAIPVIKNLFS